MRTPDDLPEDQIEDLKVLGEQLNLSRTELIRRAVAIFVSGYRRTPEEDAFGLGKERSEDGLDCQARLRSERDS